MALLRRYIAALLLGTVVCYRSYQDEVPNSDMVPHPCKTNYFWRGLGHISPLGGGPRNPFGLDFAKVHRWTPELCRMDSDGDNKTNGEELGDPNCVWTKGTFPERRIDITHPGVCEPWGSPQCAHINKEVSCETGEFICDGINDPDVFNITLRFPPTMVPARETNYMCFTFELDMLDPNTDYHLIATKPFIDNANVMHHTILTGCDVTSTALTEPELCSMTTTGCEQNLAIWTLGMPGECVYKDAGFKIGRKSGMHRLNMQHHWTNPQLRTDYVDSSGLVLYLTTKLRPYNAAFFTTGETRLVIPPGMDRVVKTSTCTGRCTRKLMKDTVKLLTGWNHMHYLGYQQNVELFRNDIKQHDLTPDKTYSYDSPVVHKYNPVIELRPGDTLKTTCVYKSTSRTTTAQYGEGTFDEMCYGIFTYYPAENMYVPGCTTWDNFELCDFDNENFSFLGCQYTMLFNESDPIRNQLFSKILDNCNYYGGCRTECPAAVSEVRQHPCFKGEMRAFMSDQLRVYGHGAVDVTPFLAGLHSCDCPRDPDSTTFPTSGSGTIVTVILGPLLFVLNEMFL